MTITRRLATTLTLLILAAPPIARAAPPGAVDVGSRREPFVDHHLIDALSQTDLRMHRPVDRGPVMSFDSPWEGPFTGYATIIHADGKYRAF